MKRLILLRHAKAVPSGGGDDRLRDLQPRGLRDATAAGDAMSAGGWAPQLALVSPSSRTQQTYEAVAPRLASPPRLHIEPRLYDASLRTILATIGETPPDVACLLVIGHNPGLAQTAVRLAQTGDSADRGRIAQGFPTAAFAVLAFGDRPWSDIDQGGTLEALVLP